MLDFIQRTFSCTVHPTFDGERETYAVLLNGVWHTVDSLGSLWALLVEAQPEVELEIAA